MEPHHHQVVGATRFFESKFYRFVVDRASSIVCFGAKLKERFCERSVPVKQRIFRVMIEFDCSHLDEVVDRA